MSTYTTLLKNYIESFTDYKNAKTEDISVYDKIETGRTHLFDFSFPWYSSDETTLIGFETDFIIHYYYEEIGFETIGLFKMRLNDILRRNMLRYQKIYNSDYTLSQILKNRDITYNDVKNLISSANGTNKTEYQGIHSDNPQVTYIEQDYASEMDRYNNNNTTNTESTGKETSDRTESGYIGDKLGDLIRYRNHIININNTIIEDCNELFMGIFATNEIRMDDFNFLGYGNRNNVGRSIDWER